MATSVRPASLAAECCQHATTGPVYASHARARPALFLFSEIRLTARSGSGRWGSSARAPTVDASSRRTRSQVWRLEPWWPPMSVPPVARDEPGLPGSLETLVFLIVPGPFPNYGCGSTIELPGFRRFVADNIGTRCRCQERV